MQKIAYKVRNWSQYNRALINRGNLTIWISDDVRDGWLAKGHKKRPGRRYLYSNSCIEAMLTVRTIFRLPLRGVQGFFEGLEQMLGNHLKIPHYSRLSRRATSLEMQIKRMREQGKEPVDLVIDSTGLKIYGEGEWKMRTHGKQKRRIWRKYHVSVDEKSQEVVAMVLTEANVHDGTQMGKLLASTPKLGKVYADGAYPGKSSMDAIAIRGGTPLIPVRYGTCIVKKSPSPGQELRNQLIRDKREAGGKKAWKKISGYHRRSLVETHMFRIKTIFGGSLRSRTFAHQQTEATIMANALNRMTALGMPRSERILLNP